MNACRAITKECKRRKKADDKVCNHPATLRSQELPCINIIVNDYRAWKKRLDLKQSQSTLHIWIGKLPIIFQEIGIFESKYRQVSWKALFSFQIGNSALSYIKIQLNQCFSESLFKLASLRHKIPLKSHHFTGSSQSWCYF